VGGEDASGPVGCAAGASAAAFRPVGRGVRSVRAGGRGAGIGIGLVPGVRRMLPIRSGPACAFCECVGTGGAGRVGGSAGGGSARSAGRAGCSLALSLPGRQDIGRLDWSPQATRRGEARGSVLHGPGGPAAGVPDVLLRPPGPGAGRGSPCGSDGRDSGNRGEAEKRVVVRAGPVLLRKPGSRLRVRPKRVRESFVQSTRRAVPAKDSRTLFGRGEFSVDRRFRAA